MNNLKLLLQNVTKSHYLNDLNFQLWIYAEGRAAKTTQGLNPELFLPEEGNVLVSNSVAPFFGASLYLFDIGIDLKEKPPPHRNYALDFQRKEFGTFSVPLAKNPPILCAASPELHSFRQEPGELLDVGLKSPWPINPGFCPVLSPSTGLVLQPLLHLEFLKWRGGEAGSAVLVPCRELREILGQQSVDTAHGAGAGMLLQPRPDALRGQRRNLGKRSPAGG